MMPKASHRKEEGSHARGRLYPPLSPKLHLLHQAFFLNLPMHCRFM